MQFWVSGQALFMERHLRCNKMWVLSTGCSTGLGTGVAVAILANWTHFSRVIGTSASAKTSSKVSLFTIGSLPRAGTWPVLDAALLMVFTVLGRQSISWLKFEDVGGSWQGLSGKDLKSALYSSSRALSLCNSFSWASTLSMAWSCIWERAATCAFWACSSSRICSTLSHSASNNWAISGASFTATQWHIRLSWWAQVQWRFCSTMVFGVTQGERSQDLPANWQIKHLFLRCHIYKLPS